MTTFDYNYQNSFRFCFVIEICQSRWGLKNNSPNLHKKTTNWRILVVVVKWRHRAIVPFMLNGVSQFNLKFQIISHPRTNQKGWCDFLRCICFVHFALKICSVMRPACERRALVVHEASEMDTGKERSERTTADRRQSIFRQRPQEHDERTVSKSHSLLFNNSVLYRFAIYLSWKYIKGIRTKYFMCKKCAYFLSLVVFIAGILCCTLCK